MRCQELGRQSHQSWFAHERLGFDAERPCASAIGCANDSLIVDQQRRLGQRIDQRLQRLNSILVHGLPPERVELRLTRFQLEHTHRIALKLAETAIIRDLYVRIEPRSMISHQTFSGAAGDRRTRSCPRVRLRPFGRSS